MISGYWCKLRQVPLKVLPFCRVPVKFIGYLTRPLGFFFVSVDTDKSSRAQSSAMPRPAERIWGLTFANLRHSEIDRNFGVLRIYCRVLIRLLEWHILLSQRMTYIALPMGVYVELVITRNILSCFSIFPLLISSGTRTAFPMGVAPEATAKDLCLGVGSTPYVAIFSPVTYFVKISRVREQRSRWE